MNRRQFLQLSAAAATMAAVMDPLLNVPAAAQTASIKPLLAGRDLSDIQSLDPHRAYETTYLITDEACYDTLLTFNQNKFDKLVSRLATSWEVPPDGKKLTFRLRPGVKFASGNPLTADVFKWSLERLQRIQGNPSYLMDPVESVDAPNDSTLVINLKQPDATFLSVLTSPFFVPVDRELIKQHGGTNDSTDKADAWLTEHTAGTGSYAIKLFKRDDRLEFEANPGAWARPKINSMLIKHFGETAALRLALERGDIDLVASGLPNDELGQLKGRPHVKISQTPSFVIFYVAWTQDPSMHKALADPRVGQAIKYAMNYDSYKTLFPGVVRPAGQVPIGLPGALTEKEAIQYNPAHAKQLLQDAGYPNGFDVKISTEAGLYSGYDRATVVQRVQQDLAKVGIRGRAEIEESSVFLKKMRAGEKEFIVELTWPDYADALSLIEWFSPAGPWGKRSRGYKDDTLVQFINTARATIDTDKRIGVYRQAVRRLIDKSPMAVLFQIPQAVPYRDNLQNVYPDLITIIKPEIIARG
jgi:peptide/nickel transport system substrate-binding protein